MAGPGPVLKEIHRLRRHIHELETRITQSPRQLQLQKSKLEQAEENLKKAQDEIKHLKVKIHDRELSIKTSYQQIEKWEKQRDKVENKKEYDALNHEIADAHQRIKNFEEEVFEAMMEVDDKTAQLPAVEKITQQVRAEVANFQKDYEERLKRFGQERDQAAEQLRAVETGLPEEIRPVYRKMILGKGVDSMSPIEGRTCAACYTEVTSQMANEINRGAFIQCKSCGRMLYV